MTGSQPLPRNVITGFALRLARDTTQPPVSREQFAASLSVSSDTVAGWESGRRPLAATQVGQMAAIRHRLISDGARPDLVSMMDQALEADYIVDFAISLGADYRPGDVHPLGNWVLRRETVDLIAWPISTRVPAGLQLPPSRGQRHYRPFLDDSCRTRFFGHLRRVVEVTAASGDTLLRRQALYLLSFDSRDDARSFLAAHRALGCI
jgi:transcriptional regulator with XRE-family HTH domain